ncbi:radical SAM protein [Desulfurococcus amylolyticus]|uniref:Radical SAM domain protein n=1 Tax=Desulfurococcus amylolyticus (strain DSM 18924 / JCM 16383 / VKM B-2413 / 1221n) TaxID=490899 RepID=B8D3N2_DESA1|nr:radical SAM protein [Desulfurococcus amylolyticus]ACL10713.1 Radical SAM domain protein [Desulfurococcus amylolyticus 1221n]
MELNTIYKNPVKVKARIAYIYPSIYRVMISSLAPDIIYQLSNSMNEAYTERFTNTRLTGDEPPPRSLETNTPLKYFGLILTTLHYEPDIVNLVRLLIAGKIPVKREQRDTPIIAGGPVVMENPIPYSGIIDAFVIGEAEVTLEKVLLKWFETMDKKRFLEEIAGLTYVYVPGVNDGEKIIRKYVERLDDAAHPVHQVENTEIEPIYGGGFKLEVSRGCPYWCSFCLESRVFQPYRERSIMMLKEIMEEGLSSSIWGRRVVIYSLSFPVSPTHVKLLEYISQEKIKASLPSLRLTALRSNVLELIKEIGQRTLSLAPETFSPLLHRVFFKYVSLHDEIANTIEDILKQGFNIKLYMIYGVKGTRIDEVKIDINTLKKLASSARRHGRELSISLNPLIPKPHTMFQWIGMEEPAKLKEILGLYRGELRGLIDARPYDIEWGFIQAYIALSSMPLDNVFINVATRGGGLSAWRKTLGDRYLRSSYVLKGYEFGGKLPWEFIVLGDLPVKTAEKQYEVFLSLSGGGSMP